MYTFILARKIQEKLQKEMDNLNKTVKKMVDADDHIKSFWMFKFDLSEAQFQKTYEECFHFYTRVRVEISNLGVSFQFFLVYCLQLT